MEMDFLAVVGDGVFVALGIPPQRHEIALVVIPAEKSVKVVENVGFEFGVDFRFSSALAQRKILFAEIAAVIFRVEVSFGVQRFFFIAVKFLFDLCGDFRELPA